MKALRRYCIPVVAVPACAALLAIPAASNVGIPATAPYFTRAITPSMAPDADGFLRRWLLLEPISIPIRSNQALVDSFVQANLKKEYFANQFTVVPRDGDKVRVGDAELVWHALDATGYNVNLFHFATALKKPAFNAIYWAVTIVNCPQVTRDVRLSVGSNSASIWWVNGREVIDLYGDRHMLTDDGVSKRLTLQKGQNIVRVAVVNAPGLSNMCARFLDANDKPLKGFTLSVAGRSSCRLRPGTGWRSRTLHRSGRSPSCASRAAQTGPPALRAVPGPPATRDSTGAR